MDGGSDLSGGHAVHYRCDEGADWYPDLDDIRARITPRTRGLVLINPNNPTGAVYGSEFLLEVIEIARQHNLIIFADEIYDKILYDDISPHQRLHPVRRCDGGDLQRLSKAYRACGFRQGWMVITGPKGRAKGYIEGLEMLASMRLCANVPMQHAIQTALGGYQSINELILPGGCLRRQRDKAWSCSTTSRGLLRQTQGALYMFPRLDPKVYDIRDDQKMVFDLLQQENCCWCRAPASTGRHRITSGWCSCPGRGAGRGHLPSRPLPQGLQAVSKAHEKAPAEPFAVCRFLSAHQPCSRAPATSTAMVMRATPMMKGSTQRTKRS